MTVADEAKVETDAGGSRCHEQSEVQRRGSRVFVVGGRPRVDYIVMIYFI